MGRHRNEFGERTRGGNGILDKNIGLQWIYFTSSIVWLELVYHLFTFGSIQPYILYQILFSCSVGGLMCFITAFFGKRGSRIISWTFLVVVTIYFCVQLVYYSIFRTPLLFDLAQNGTQAVTAYWKETLQGILDNIVPLILMLFPVIFYAIVERKKEYRRSPNRAFQLMVLFVAVLAYVVPVTSINIKGSGNSIYSVYHELSDPDLAAEQLGILTTFRLDIQHSIFGLGKENLSSDLVVEGTAQPDSDATKEDSDSVEVDNNVQERKWNRMDINFDQLISDEKDEDIIALHKYFQATTPTKQNEYTGMFQGYNLIFITAEAFSPWAVDEKLTPTLYKLVNNGFVCKNFYTPIWQTSTSDGEYVACNSLIPNGTRSFSKAASNYFPFSMAMQFNRLGVVSRAYHNGSFTYYDRDKTHTDLGYVYKAAKLGANSSQYSEKNLFKIEHPDWWPQSDVEMFDATVKEYDGETPFHTYYMTISGHMNYSFSGNMQAYRHKDEVKNLPYTDAAKAYVACNIELDKGLESLIQQLEEKGVLDKTVICLSGDHYPYGLEISDIESIQGENIDTEFELYHSNLILWNSAMKEKVEVDKMCSSLDILPTLSNLFGFTYDSRLMFGRDILSTAEPLVIFKNRSFITDKIKYNASTNKVTYLVDKSLVDEDYVEQKKQEVKNRFVASAGVMEQDYYKKIMDVLSFQK